MIWSYVPEERMTNAVKEQTIRVSTMVPKDWIIPCLTGCLTSAMEDRLVMVPIPASLDHTPLCIPAMMTAPIPPPITEGMLNAYSNMETMPLTTPSGPSAMQMMHTTNQAIAMSGGPRSCKPLR